MKLSTIFTLWIMLNYTGALFFYAFTRDVGRALYWLFAIGIMGTSMFLIK